LPSKSIPNTSVFGYGITHGVDKDYFDLWLEQNKDAPYVVNKPVFAIANATHADAAARDHEKQVSGFEPMNPSGDARTSNRHRPQNREIRSRMKHGVSCTFYAAVPASWMQGPTSEHQSDGVLDMKTTPKMRRIAVLCDPWRGLVAFSDYSRTRSGGNR
jgi:hypothetical protein